MTIAIVGAGLIGRYLGGSLIATGADVMLIGRARIGEQISKSGLELSDLDGGALRLTPNQIKFRTDPSCLAGCQLILVTVKSADTEAAAASIAQYADQGALIISFQNGVGNVELLRANLPNHRVLAAMVPFNVAQMADGRLHRGTEGELKIEASPLLDNWLGCFSKAGLALHQRPDMVAVQWGKLLLNLNNSVNALADLPLRQQLSQRGYRLCLALLIDEALTVLKCTGIAPAKLARVAPALLPTILRLPDFLFMRVAAAMLRIDPEARSSMWEDLNSGRLTEVDYLNGAVVRLANSVGADVRFNKRITTLIHLAEQGGQRTWSAAQLHAAISHVD